jgi:hypothetical protein
VKLLAGLAFEVKGNLDGAKAVYEALIKEDETNVVSRSVTANL